MKKSTTAVIAVSTFGLGLGAGAVGMLAAGGTDSVSTSSSSANATGDWKKVDQVRQMIEQNYLEDVTDKELLDGALSVWRKCLTIRIPSIWMSRRRHRSIRIYRLH